MLVEANPSLLYSDILLPEVFITEYLPGLSGEAARVYIFMLFLSKHDKESMPLDISKKLGIEQDKVNDILLELESVGVINRGNNKISLVDLKEKEIRKLYRPKTTSTPQEMAENMEKNRSLNATIAAINDKFFQGLMSPSWYSDIDNWFERYKFDEDVMYTLFQHCSDHNALSRNYVEKVAKSWSENNIRSSIDLDKYYVEYQKIKDIKQKIVKKLKLGRLLTEYEEEYVEKWRTVFKFDFAIIEEVLKKTTGKTSPNFNYLNAILTDWFEKGVRTLEDAKKYSQTTSVSAKKDKKQDDSSVKQLSNFKQREYQGHDFSVYYKNLKKTQ